MDRIPWKLPKLPLDEQEVLYLIAEEYRWPGMQRHGTLTYFLGTDRELLRVNVPHVGARLDIDLHSLSLSTATVTHIGAINHLADETNNSLQSARKAKDDAASLDQQAQRAILEEALRPTRRYYAAFGSLCYAPHYDIAVIVQRWRECGML